jgi:hypothetical protein
MMGVHNSLSKKLQDDIPHLFILCPIGRFLPTYEFLGRNSYLCTKGVTTMITPGER